MNYKTSFIIIAMISFGFGIIADRFVFSSKPSEINKNSDENQNANSTCSSNRKLFPATRIVNHNCKSDFTL